MAHKAIELQCKVFTCNYPFCYEGYEDLAKLEEKRGNFAGAFIRSPGMLLGQVVCRFLQISVEVCGEVFVKFWRSFQVFLAKISGVSGKKRLTRQNPCYIMYNCDVRRKCFSQSPGDSILRYMFKTKIIENHGNITGG